MRDGATLTTVPRPLLTGFLALHGLAHLAGASDCFAKTADGGAVDSWTVSDPTLRHAFGRSLSRGVPAGDRRARATRAWAPSPGADDQ